MHMSFAITKTLINVRLNMFVLGNAYYCINALGYLYIQTTYLRIADRSSIHGWYLWMCFNSHFYFIYLNTLTIKSAKFPKLKTLFTGWIMQCLVALIFKKCNTMATCTSFWWEYKVCRSCFNIQIEVLWEFIELMFNCTWSMINHSHVTWDPTSCHTNEKVQKIRR